MKFALGILQHPSVKPEIEKARRLRKIGFTKAKQSLSLDEERRIKEAVAKEDYAELIKYYSIKYPNNKFIEEHQVTSICDKYHLIKGEINRYEGFVPNHSLKAIEEFKKNFRQPDDLQRFALRGFYFPNSSELWGKDIILEWPKDPKLLICAPENEMRDYLQFGRTENEPIPDPVVLQPVINGYLIVASWGDEASDEMVLNPKHN